MKGLIKKVRENKKGFTLAELLVVVAIVGILVAISIPVFTAQLSKARKATNQANMRAAKAAAIAQYLTDEAESTSAVTYKYVLETGEAKSIKSDDSGYIVETGKEIEIDAAASDEKYTKINVVIIPKVTGTGTATEELNGAEIKIYAKK
ncbi:type IV pilin protein [uncultured Clostridium sp.]|uniref:type IV pilin protein n=1 Tax=uncultured Clostridium sp. TaxID=59620 RepID=UPI0025CD096D|nr:prepilin-type N-terminal cleavage/methylation domain-containing protein [uncultured Clostridium sp.]